MKKEAEKEESGETLTMKPYQVRMVKEYDEVHTRYTKLIRALNNGVFDGEAKTLADDQRRAMVAYMKALRARAKLDGFDIITGQPIKHTEGGK